MSKNSEHAYQVFNEKEKVKRWLSKHSGSLHDESPLSPFSTPNGIGMVEDVLTNRRWMIKNRLLAGQH